MGWDKSGRYWIYLREGGFAKTPKLRFTKEKAIEAVKMIRESGFNAKKISLGNGKYVVKFA